MDDQPTHEVHPALAPFPEMAEDRLELLAADIKRRGLLEPVTTWKGYLLNGRARVKACQVAGVPLETKEYDGDDPVGVVTAGNLRRDLTQSQRAAIAATLATLKRGRRQIPG